VLLDWFIQAIEFFLFLNFILLFLRRHHVKLLELLFGSSLVEMWLIKFIIWFFLKSFIIVISKDVVRGPVFIIVVFDFEVLIGKGLIGEVLGVIVNLDKSVTLIGEPGSTVDGAHEAESEHSTSEFPDLFLESLHMFGLSLGHLDTLSAACFSIGILLKDWFEDVESPSGLFEREE